MRVTHVITRLVVGGAQENTIASVVGLQRKTGWPVRLISGPPLGAEGSLASLLEQQPDTLIILPELVRPIHPWKDAVALRRLERQFRADPPDLVHTHSGKAGFLGRLAAARAGVPIIVHTLHGPSFGPFQGWAANWLFRTAERWAGRVTHHFVAVADAMIEQHLAAGIGRPEQYTRIFSGFDVDAFLSVSNDLRRREHWGIAPDDIVVGYIARLCKLKGHDDLLEVAPQLLADCPQLKFLWVGDGPWRERFQHKVHAAGLQDRFVFTGLVAPHEIPALTGIMDIVAHFSRREGLPRALSQALAAGRPVVAYDCDGAGEVCMNAQTGYLLEPGDLAGIRSRLVELARNPALRAELGRRGREFVVRQFGTDAMVEALHALYIRLAQKAKG